MKFPKKPLAISPIGALIDFISAFCCINNEPIIQFEYLPDYNGNIYSYESLVILAFLIE